MNKGDGYIRRPLFNLAISFLLGTVLAVYYEGKGSLFCLPPFILLFLSILFILYLKKADFPRLNNSILFYILMVLMFFVSVTFSNYMVKRSVLDDSYLQKNVNIKGKINDLKKTEYGYFAVLTDYKINDTGSALGKLYITFNSKTSPHIGEYIEFSGIVREFDSVRNAGQFDYKKYYNSLGINYRVNCNSFVVVKQASAFETVLENIRNSINTQIETFSIEEQGLVKSIILGDKTELDDEMYESFKKYGIAHILAISALHISVLCYGIECILKKIINSRFVVFSIVTVFMLSYSILIGNPVSAKRAVIMCILKMAAALIGRTYDAKTALAISYVILAIENVKIIQNYGFLMSFGALLGIVYVKPVLDAVISIILKNYIQKNPLLKTILFSLSASISVNTVTFPIILFFSYEFPLYSVFLNVIVVFLMSLVLFCAVIGIIVSYLFVPGAIFLNGTIHYILNFYTWLCEFISKLPLSVIVTGKPEPINVILYFVFLVLAIALVKLTFIKTSKQNKKYSLISSIILVISAIFILTYRAPVGARVDMLDVGQGLCMVIRNGNSCILFDGGSSDINKVGKKRILPFLKSERITTIDCIFISHTDEDHISGIIELLDNTDKIFCIKRIVLPDISSEMKNEGYKSVLEKASEKSVIVDFSNRGDIFTDKKSDLKFECIAPHSKMTYSDLNSASAVYIAEISQLKILLTGDINAVQEADILKMYDLKDIDILQVAHHGSKNSSDQQFINNVNPCICLISCGIDNRYGHPHEETIKRLEATGSKILRTDELGAIILTISPSGEVKKKGWMIGNIATFETADHPLDVERVEKIIKEFFCS